MTDPVHSFRPDGSLMDLARPDPAEIDFREVAGGLSRIARFNGRPNGTAYSVAQHSVMGADAIARETGSPYLAGLFLLHDGHEYLLNDWPTPAQKLLAATLERLLPRSARGKDVVARAIAAMKDAWDTAIYTAAGLPAPATWSSDERDVIVAMDARMLAAEAKALFGDRAIGRAGVSAARPPKLKGAIHPWGAAKAEERFVMAFIQYIGEDAMAGAAALHAAHRAPSA